MARADSIRRAYRRAFAAEEVATITRGAATAGVRVRARDRGEEDLAGATDRGRAMWWALAEDFGAFGAPLEGDVLAVGGVDYVVAHVDDHSRRAAGVVYAYGLEVYA